MISDPRTTTVDRHGPADAAAVVVVREGLAASGFTVTHELTLPTRTGYGSTSTYGGPSVRLDVVEDRDSADRVVTAVRLYTGDPVSPTAFTGLLSLSIARSIPGDVGSNLRALVDGKRAFWSRSDPIGDPSDLEVPSNADVERLLALAARTELAGVVNQPKEARDWRDSRLGAFDDADSRTLYSLVRVVGLEDDVTLHEFALAERVLDGIVSGAPLEWALRHAAGSGS